MIYFVQAVGGGPIKIGCTADIITRIRDLERRYGKPLSLLGTMPGGLSEEQAIHARFDHLRFGTSSGRGRRPEQFRPDPELMEFIGRPSFVNQGDVELMPAVNSTGRPVRLDLLPRVHRLLRLISADEEVSMAAYARDLLATHLEAEAKRRGIKV